MIGGRLAKATFEPELVMTDGEALLVENILPVGVDAPEKVVAGWNPYRTMFDVVWSGRRHVIMGASQIDTYGNQNFAFIGDPDAADARSCSACAARPATRSTTRRRTGSRTTRRGCSCPRSTSSAASATTAPPSSAERGRFHEIVRVVTNLCVLDFDTPDHRMRLRSRAPGRHRRRGGRGDRLRARDRRRRARDRGCRPTRSCAGSARSSTRNGLGEQEVPNP